MRSGWVGGITSWYLRCVGLARMLTRTCHTSAQGLHDNIWLLQLRWEQQHNENQLNSRLGG
jgi:hypothetical protein